MLQSKPIILDTSTWIRHIDCNKLHDAIKDYYSIGFFPLLTLHNIKELINTNNDELRKKRLVQISTIEHIYKFSDIPTPPSILNLCNFEFKFLLNKKNEIDYYDELKTYIQDKLILTSGRELIGELDLFTEELNSAINTNQEQLFFASVPPKLHHDKIDSGKIKLKDLDLNNLSKENFDKLKEKILEVLHQKGDKKKQHLSNDVEKFLETKFKNLLSNTKDDKLQYFAMAGGLSINEISLEMTYDDYSSIIEKNRKLRVIAENIGIEFEKILTVDIDSVPTFIFDKSFQSYYQNKIIRDIPRRAESSIIEDRYLASFSMYFDVIVDKRTGEVLKGIQKQIPYSLNYHINKINNIGHCI